MKIFWLVGLVNSQELPDDVYIRDGEVLGQTRFVRSFSGDREGFNFWKIYPQKLNLIFFFPT